MTEKRNIHALIEKEAPSLNNLLDPNDVKEFKEMTSELRDTWTKKQVFRTETEMRMSVLQDAKYPTKAAKYWQCVREQNVFFENLMSLSFDYRKNEVKIKKLKRKLESETDDLKKELLEILIEEKLYGRANMELVAKDRMREVSQWSQLKTEYDDGSFDNKNVNTHQAESYKLMLTNKVKTLTPGSSQPEVFNVVGQLHTLERLEKEGVLLPYSAEAKAKLGYKPNTQNQQDLGLSTAGDISTKPADKELNKAKLAYKEASTDTK